MPKLGVSSEEKAIEKFEGSYSKLNETSFVDIPQRKLGSGVTKDQQKQFLETRETLKTERKAVAKQVEDEYLSKVATLDDYQQGFNAQQNIIREFLKTPEKRATEHYGEIKIVQDKIKNAQEQLIRWQQKERDATTQEKENEAEEEQTYYQELILRLQEGLVKQQSGQLLNSGDVYNYASGYAEYEKSKEEQQNSLQEDGYVKVVDSGQTLGYIQMDDIPAEISSGFTSYSRIQKKDLDKAYSNYEEKKYQEQLQNQGIKNLYSEPLDAYYDPKTGEVVKMSMIPEIAEKQGLVKVQLKGETMSGGDIIYSETGLLTPTQLAGKKFYDSLGRVSEALPTDFIVGGSSIEKLDSKDFIAQLTKPSSYNLARSSNPYGLSDAYGKEQIKHYSDLGYTETESKALAKNFLKTGQKLDGGNAEHYLRMEADIAPEGFFGRYKYKVGKALQFGEERIFQPLLDVVEDIGGDIDLTFSTSGNPLMPVRVSKINGNKVLGFSETMDYTNFFLNQKNTSLNGEDLFFTAKKVNPRSMIMPVAIPSILAQSTINNKKNSQYLSLLFEEREIGTTTSGKALRGVADIGSYFVPILGEVRSASFASNVGGKTMVGGLEYIKRNPVEFGAGILVGGGIVLKELKSLKLAKFEKELASAKTKFGSEVIVSGELASVGVLSTTTVGAKEFTGVGEQLLKLGDDAAAGVGKGFIINKLGKGTQYSKYNMVGYSKNVGKATQYMDDIALAGGESLLDDVMRVSYKTGEGTGVSSKAISKIQYSKQVKDYWRLETGGYVQKIKNLDITDDILKNSVAGKFTKVSDDISVMTTDILDVAIEGKTFHFKGGAPKLRIYGKQGRSSLIIDTPNIEGLVAVRNVGNSKDVFTITGGGTQLEASLQKSVLSQLAAQKNLIRNIAAPSVKVMPESAMKIAMSFSAASQVPKRVSAKTNSQKQTQQPKQSQQTSSLIEREIGVNMKTPEVLMRSIIKAKLQKKMKQRQTNNQRAQQKFNQNQDSFMKSLISQDVLQDLQAKQKQRQRTKQTQKMKNLLKQSPNLKEFMAPVVNPINASRILLPLLARAKKSVSIRKKKRDQGFSDDLVYTEDFTSKIMGMSEVMNKKDFEKFVREKTFTGFETRRRIIINNQGRPPKRRGAVQVDIW